MIDEMRPSPARGFLHPAIMLAGILFAVALLLLPFAIGRSDSGGVAGLLTACAVCLFTGWLAEGAAYLLSNRVAPVGLVLIGMAIRATPPMVICIGLLASGQSGRSHLAFISYLITFYLLTLALETYSAVRRIGQSSSKLSRANPSALS
jgi:hypothetical protein